MATISTMNSASAIEAMPSQAGEDQEDDQRDEGRHHEHVAMGEIHHADDAEHHRVADGDQAIDRAERDAVDELLEEDFHALRSGPWSGPPGWRPVESISSRLNKAGRERQRSTRRRVIKSRAQSKGNRAHDPQRLEIAIRVGGATVVFAAMALWEWLAPRRDLTVGRRPRWPGNLGILAIDIIAVRLLVPTAAVGVALIAAAHGWGLLHVLGCRPGPRSWLA